MQHEEEEVLVVAAPVAPIDNRKYMEQKDMYNEMVVRGLKALSVELTGDLLELFSATTFVVLDDVTHSGSVVLRSCAALLTSQVAKHSSQIVFVNPKAPLIAIGRKEMRVRTFQGFVSDYIQRIIADKSFLSEIPSVYILDYCTSWNQGQQPAKPDVVRILSEILPASSSSYFQIVITFSDNRRCIHDEAHYVDEATEMCRKFCPLIFRYKISTTPSLHGNMMILTITGIRVHTARGERIPRGVTQFISFGANNDDNDDDADVYVIEEIGSGQRFSATGQPNLRAVGIKTRKILLSSTEDFFREFGDVKIVGEPSSSSSSSSSSLPPPPSPPLLSSSSPPPATKRRRVHLEEEEKEEEKEKVEEELVTLPVRRNCAPPIHFSPVDHAAERQDKRQSELLAILSGMQVQKWFPSSDAEGGGGAMFTGIVGPKETKSGKFHKKYFHVKYEDNDTEDLILREVLEILVDKEVVERIRKM